MKTCVLGNRDADAVLIQPVDEHEFDGLRKQVSAIRERTDVEFCLVAARIDDWNRELSPWEAPAVFGREDFGGGAAETLAAIRELCADRSRRYYIGGYSLAALFALWAATRTDLFRGVAAASPSVWFPGFTDYLREHPTRSGMVYLSLGDREEKTRNPLMATVAERIRETEEILRTQGVRCSLEWNPGNHFTEPELRTAKVWSRVLNGDPDNITTVDI